METNLEKSKVNNDPIKIFNYKDLGSLRCHIDLDGQKWFCHKDVCDILGIKDYNANLKRLDAKGVWLKPTHTNSGIQFDSFINQGNLFRFITRSRKKEAEEFTDWVCDIVLPALISKERQSVNRPMTLNEIILQLALNVQNMNDRIEKLETWKNGVFSNLSSQIKES